MLHPVVSEPAADSATRIAARHNPASHLRFWLAASVFCTLDLWSKWKVFRTLRPDEIRTIIPQTIEFRRSLNDGAVFGSLTGQVELFIVASLLAVAFVLYLFLCSARSQWALHVSLGLVMAGTLGNLYDRVSQTADIVSYQNPNGRRVSIIGKLLSGPDDPFVRIGDWPEGTNVQVYRRSEVEVRRQGVVRDFIKFVPKLPKWVPQVGGRDAWPWIFNVADAALVVGVSILLLSNIRRRPSSSDLLAADRHG